MRICPACEVHGIPESWLCPRCGSVATETDGVVRLIGGDAPLEEGFEGSFFAPLAEAEAGHFWFESRNRLLQWAFGRSFAATGRFLEIGCGTGFVLRGFRSAFPALDLAGSELFAEGLSVARRRVPDASFYQMDARHIPFAAEFDGIGAFDVLEHIEEDEQVLSQMHRATVPGGGILLTVPQHPWLWSEVDDYSHHRRRYTRRELVSKVERVGFVVEWVTSFVTVLLPLVALSRRRRRREEAFDPMAEFRVPRPVNALLGALLGLERAAIVAGARLPVGSSLLLVARRES